jgi:hypothetical protein
MMRGTCVCGSGLTQQVLVRQRWLGGGRQPHAQLSPLQYWVTPQASTTEPHAYSASQALGSGVQHELLVQTCPGAQTLMSQPTWPPQPSDAVPAHVDPQACAADMGLQQLLLKQTWPPPQPALHWLLPPQLLLVEPEHIPPQLLTGVQQLPL